MVTKEKYKLLRMPLFYSLFLVYMEVCFILGTFGMIDFGGFTSCIFFSMSIGLLFTVFSSFFSSKVNKAITIAIIAFITVIFIAQLVYYNIYSSIFSIYSIANGSTQVMEFWRKILDVVFAKVFYIAIFVLPLILFSKLGSKFIEFKPIKIKLKAVFVGFLVLTYLLGLSFLFISPKDLYSPYKLYFNTHSPSLSTKKLGLLTAMRLDVRYEIFGDKSLETYELNQQGLEDKEQSSGNSTAVIVSPEEIVKKVEYNKIDIDFDTLIEKESDETIKSMHQYFKSVEATEKNDYTGLFKGKNLVLVLAESFSPLAIDEKLTPTLYKMSKQSYKFTNFYTPIWPVSTSDGEYMTSTSLIPKEGVWSMAESSNNYLPFVMGNMMLQDGYNTYAYHNHSYTYYKRNLSHPNMGFETFKAVGNGLKINKKTWPESDLEMINNTVNEYINAKPFIAYYVTVSGHLEYNKYNAMALENWSYVDDLDYSTAAKAYLSCNIELDRAMESLIKQLEDAGIADDTVIALSGDHYPYGLTVQQMRELKGEPIEKNFELYENTLLVWNKDVEPVSIDKPASSMDISLL